MKALAAEMVQNFGKRLSPLGIAVRELTGDMQLTKAEILKTQVTYSLSFKGSAIDLLVLNANCLRMPKTSYKLKSQRQRKSFMVMCLGI